MSLKQYHFKPSVTMTVLTLLLLPILIKLGYWQLQRADFKQRLQNQYYTQTQAQSVPLASLDLSTDINFKPVKLQGKFDSAHLIFLDNKIHQHQIGYQVLVPFKISHSQQAVLINLGWIAQGKDRKYLPTLTLPQHELSLEGTINYLPNKSFSLGSNVDPSQQTWPLRLQHVDIAYLTQRLGYPIQPFMILLAANQPFGLICNWTPVMLNPQMHFGYAFQWFALAVTLVILFIITSVKRR